MKVVHLISSSGVYGAEKMVVGLCEALAQFGVDASLEVFDNQHSRNVDVADFARAVGVPVTLLRCGGRFDPRAVRRLRADGRRRSAAHPRVQGEPVRFLPPGIPRADRGHQPPVRHRPAQPVGRPRPAPRRRCLRGLR